METNLQKSTTGYSCPTCNTFSSTATLTGQTNAKLVNLESDPRYEWEEYHKCTRCGTEYQLTNCT